MHDAATTDATEQSLADSLSTITEHWEGMSERRAIRPRVGRRPAPGSTPPVNAGIIQVRATTDHRMRVLALLLLEDHPDARPPHPDVTGPEMADHLWTWVRELAEVATLSDAEELASSARQVLHHAAPTRPDWMRIGACPLLMEDGSTCGGEVRGWPHHTDEDGQAWCRCEHCGVQAVSSWWEDRGMGAVGEVLTTSEVCDLARQEFGRSLPEGTVWRWVNHGKIHPVRRGTKPLEFDRNEVVRALTAMC